MNQLVKASINLHAVLRSLEDLCQLNEKAKNLIQGKNIGVRFVVPGIDPLILSFQSGKCQAIRGAGSTDIHLSFLNPNHFNQMVEGTKNPIPLKGLTKLSFMTKEFSELAEILTDTLMCSKEALKDKSFRDMNTLMTAMVAFFSLSEIANLDPLGQKNASRIQDGAIQIEIIDSEKIYILANGGKLTTVKGVHPSPLAFMTFDSIDTAGGILRGELDSYACIGNGKLQVKGRIPMIDNLNKILAQVPFYLNEV
ncbi:hypothetical protein [Guggenheimella bovis]